MMRGSVVFLAVLAAFSSFVGVNEASPVKSGIGGAGNGRGNEDAQGTGESNFGNGENDGHGHHIGKRSPLGLNLVRNPDRDAVRLTSARSAAARRQSMVDAGPVLLHTGVGAIPPPIIRPRSYSTPLKARDPTLMQRTKSIPSMLYPSGAEGEIRSLPTLKLLPLSNMKKRAMEIISNLLPTSLTLSGSLPQPRAREPLARRVNFYRSDRENRRGKNSDLRSISNLPSYPSLPAAAATKDIVLPLFKHARSAIPAHARADLDFREDVRSAFTDYLSRIWDKLKSLVQSISGHDAPLVADTVTGQDLYPPGGGDPPAEQPDQDGPVEYPGQGDIPVEYPNEITVPVEIPYEGDSVQGGGTNGEDSADFYEYYHVRPEDYVAARDSGGVEDNIVIEPDAGGHSEKDAAELCKHYNTRHDGYVDARYSGGVEDNIGDVDAGGGLNEEDVAEFCKYYHNRPEGYVHARYSGGVEDNIDDVVSTIEDTSAVNPAKKFNNALETIMNFLGRV